MTSQLVSTFVLVSCAFSVAVAQSGVNRETDFYNELANDGKKEEAVVKDLWNVIPDGTNPHTISPACDPHRLEDAALNKKLSTAQYYKVVQQYFTKCQAELSSSTGVGALIQFARFQYLFFQNPQVKKFPVKLEDGTIVPAILALKQDPRPRPLVIIRCGVFCSAVQSTSVMSYMIHMFDQAPFNVLFLANQTGMDYIYANKKVTLGGWSEGYESLMVGKWMQEKWEYRDRISSVHLMGISLGGNAAVFGASFNDKYLLDNGKKVFNSVAAICPVVSLKPTLDRLFGSQIVGRIFATNTRDHFSEARQYVKDVPDLITDDLIPSKREELPEFIGGLASASLQRRGIASTTNSFFKSNNFWNMPEEVKTPLLVWASKDDMVVNNAINAQVIADSNVYEKSPNVSVLNLKYGNHCGFSAAYGFQASAAVLRTFVLNNSPEFVDSYVPQNQMAWKFGAPSLSSSYQHVEQSFHFFSQSDQVKVNFKVFNSRGGVDCSKNGPWDAPLHCLTNMEYSVPVNSLKAMGARVPRTEVEAQALTREFNTKVEFRAAGKPLNGTRNSDIIATWRPLFE
jgi:predicted alpha/beta-fold hydrolase